MTINENHNNDARQFGKYECEKCGEIFVTELSLQGHQSNGACSE